MLEAKGNMWNAEGDVYVITTNGFVKKNGEAVMGRGCAREAVNYWPKFPKWLGEMLYRHGNHVYAFAVEQGVTVLTFPVKHNWYEKADLELIEQSLKELVAEVNSWSYRSVIMPRPGCGNGQLDWSIVKPLCEKYLDDRFIIYDYA